jgi:hypothetical protein
MFAAWIWTLNELVAEVGARVLSVLEGSTAITGVLVVAAALGLLTSATMRLMVNARQDVVLRERVHGQMLGVWLYRHAPRVVLKLQLQLLLNCIRRLRLFLLPTVLVAIPTTLLLFQMNLRLAVRPIMLGDAAIVTVKWRTLPREEHLVAPKGLTVEAGARVAAANETSWRVRALEAGIHEVELRADGTSVTKQLLAGPYDGPISQVRSQRIWTLIFHPGEPPLTAHSPAEWIEVKYPARNLNALGYSMHWTTTFTAVSTVTALLGWYAWPLLHWRDGSQPE